MKKTLVLLLLAMFVLSACGSAGFNRAGPDPATTDFYKGTKGMTARFDGFPSKLFFYSDPGSAYNEFEVSVEARNEGASWSRGAIFISGYDPNLIKFREIPILGGQLGACGISIGNFGFGSFGGMLQCEGFSVGATEGGNWQIGIDSVNDVLGSLGWDIGDLDFSFDTQSVYGQTRFTMNMLDPNLNMEYWGHGRLFISLFSGIDFTRTLGREYVLPGRSYEFPAGGVEYFTYSGIIDQMGWAPGLDEVTQPLLMTNCYFYTTYAAPLVCIDPDPYSENVKVCRPQQLTFSGSQGAPVAITSIEQENSPNKAIFRVNIKNVGRGEVFDPGQLEKCSPYLSDRVRSQDKNIVYLGDIRIGNVRLQDCTPDGMIRLTNGQGTVTCTYPLEFAGLKSAYETPLVVELWYGYSETELKRLNIKRLS